MPMPCELIRHQLVDWVKYSPISIYQAVALPSGSSTTLCNPIGICLVLLRLVVMPTTELVLPFNVDVQILFEGIDTRETLQFPAGAAAPS